MGTTGVIFVAIAVAWLAYLVPHFVRRRDNEPVEDDVEPTDDRFADSMRILRRGTAPLLDQDLAEIKAFEVSTPQTRRVAIADLRRLERQAALRRRRVLLGLMSVLSAVVGVCSVGLLPWWGAAIPGGLLLVFFVVARFSVRAMRKSLDARYREIRGGSDEQTVLISRKEAKELVAAAGVKTEAKPAAAATKAGTLWDPVPITLPTYVSKPLAPRTVRTIDLSGPGVTSSARLTVPVTADAPPEKAAPAAAASAAAEDETAQAASA